MTNLWPIVILVVGLVCRSSYADLPSHPNVLFIAVDDLRPVLGCYGNRVVQTPHMDRLAKRGVVFERAYCQVPSCCPSRTAVLTGLRPADTGVFNNRSPHFREKLQDHLTLPGYFKSQGYFCKELGKVFHLRDPVSWSEPKWIPQPGYAYPMYGTAEAIEKQRRLQVTSKPNNWWGFPKWIKVNSWESPDVADEALFDGQLATQAIKELRRPHQQPFFIAVGFFRPHLPFIAPKKYYDLYPKDALKLPGDRQLPEAASIYSSHSSPEPRTYLDINKGGPIPRESQRELLRGYYASVSYVDAQIGRVLQELKQSGLARKTVVVLWSDHGYHLGDHGLWGKATNFEQAMRSTLIVSVPGIKPGRTRGLVELVDLYPTLCELSRLPIPSGLAGQSFVPLLRSPNGTGKKAAFSQASPSQATGYSLRTNRYRLILWQQKGEIVGRELYYYQTDPQETKNIVHTANAELLRELQTLLRHGHAQLKPEKHQ